MIKLVPFYKDIKKDAAEINEMKKIFDYKNAIELLRLTFNKFNAEHEYILATDFETSVSSKIKCFRTNLNNKNIMESLVLSNTDFVHNHDGKMVLCGADHLICNKINVFFEHDFDIALFVRWDQINNTVVCVNKTPKNLKHVDNFFADREAEYYKLNNQEKQWYGDQRSFTTLLEDQNIITKFVKNNSDSVHNFKNLKIKLFNYGEYVRAIKTGGSVKINSNTVLLDFKGPKRKQHFENVFKTTMEMR
jgi:hypothetical protein